MSAHLSGWCSPSFGLPHTRRQHVACRSEVCGCEAFGGHVRNAQRPVVERDSASYMGAIRGETCDNGGTTKRAPDRVLGGPQSRALDSNILTERKC